MKIRVTDHNNDDLIPKYKVGDVIRYKFDGQRDEEIIGVHFEAEIPTCDDCGEHGNLRSPDVFGFCYDLKSGGWMCEKDVGTGEKDKSE